MRGILLIVGVLVGAATLASGARTATSGGSVLRGTVTYVVDGDTVHVEVGGHDEKVRLIGIDTPEVGQCDAAKATALARRLALGRPVALFGDSTQATRDRYGRLLAYVVLPDGRDLGYQELLRGFARVYVYDRPFKRLASYRAAERVGRTRADSVWRGCGKPARLLASCDPSYPGIRIPPLPPAVDCADVRHKRAYADVASNASPSRTYRVAPTPR